MTVDEFDANTQKFVDFLVSNGVEISPKIKVADLRAQNQGRGIISVEDIEEDEVLFTLPKTAILNYKTCEMVQNLGDEETIAQIIEKYSQWEVLILCMFYELEVLGEKSKWSAYFNVLPHKFNNLMFWSEEDLQNLKPSYIVDRIGKNKSEEIYQNLLESGLKDFNLENYKEAFTLNKFHRIASLIQSYSFDVENELYNELQSNEEQEDEEDEIEDEPIKTMVCLADTLNADTHLVNANLTYENNQLAMKAIKKIRKGQQVYNTYGEHPNSEILRRYGYVEWNQSKYDFAEVPLELVKKVLANSYDSNLEVINEILNIIAKDEEFNETFAGEDGVEVESDIISDTYECYIDGDVTPEFYFIIQILTSVLKIEKNDYGFKYSGLISMEEKKAFIKRFTKKILQLINSNKITSEAAQNYASVLNERIKQYPSKTVLSSFKIGKAAQYKPEDYVDRKVIAEFVLKCEINSLKNCLKYFEKKRFLHVEDDKLVRNLLKKYINNEEETDKRKRRKLKK